MVGGGEGIANRRRPATPGESGCAAIISSLFWGLSLFIFFSVSVDLSLQGVELYIIITFSPFPCVLDSLVSFFLLSFVDGRAGWVVSC